MTDTDRRVFKYEMLMVEGTSYSIIRKKPDQDVWVFFLNNIFDAREASRLCRLLNRDEELEN